MLSLSNKEIQSQINEISKGIFNGAVNIYENLEQLKMIVFNLKLTCARIPETPDTRALSKISDIMKESIDKMELDTQIGKNASKHIGQLINQLNLEE
jgi:hypothetical protein